jgi:hypothetical protein
MEIKRTLFSSLESHWKEEVRQQIFKLGENDVESLPFCLKMKRTRF